VRGHEPEALRAAFLALPAGTPQTAIQERLEAIHAAGGLEAALDCLYRWELAAGYITAEKLAGIERLAFPDPESGITFLLQVNHARTRYSEAVSVAVGQIPGEMVSIPANVEAWHAYGAVVSHLNASGEKGA